MIHEYMYFKKKRWRTAKRRLENLRPVTYCISIVRSSEELQHQVAPRPAAPEDEGTRDANCGARTSREETHSSPPLMAASCATPLSLTAGRTASRTTGCTAGCTTE